MSSSPDRKRLTVHVRAVLRRTFSTQTLKSIAVFYRDAVNEWNTIKAPRLAAALAFYATFSLAPLIVIVVWLAGQIFGPETARELFFQQLQTLIGPSAVGFLRDLLTTAAKIRTGPITSLMALAGLLFGAAGLFFQIQDSLNTLWDVPPRPWRGLKGLIADRIPSFIMVLGAGLVLIASLALTTLLSAVNAYLDKLAPDLTNAVQWLDLGLSFTITTSVFALLYRVVPDTAVRWRDVVLGSVSAAVLFEVGKFALRLYLRFSGVVSVYGAAGSFVALLIWIYYSAQIFLFGAQVCELYAQRLGSRRPEPKGSHTPT